MEPCNIHGEARARLAHEFGSSDLPRAELAVNLSEVTPIAIKSPTLIADRDPYGSIKPTLAPEPIPQPATHTAENQKTDSAQIGNDATAAQGRATDLNRPSVTAATHSAEAATQTTQSAPEIRKAIPVEQIRKAIPVQPQDRQPAEIRRAIPVKPLDQEDNERTLLRSAAQPPSDTND
jgi:hypothetical protein